MGKLEKHIISDSLEYSFNDGYHYYVIDGARALRTRALRTKEPLDLGGKGKDRKDMSLKKLFDYIDLYSSANQYERREVPSVQTIKDEIARLAGRRSRDTVAYKFDFANVAVNARYLKAAMEALDAKYCFAGTQVRLPIFFHQNDDILSDICEVVMPMNMTHHDPGFILIKN